MEIGQTGWIDAWGGCLYGGCRAAPRTRPNLPEADMSEKLKEFIEVPQEFLRDGNQVDLPLVYGYKL
jgi:hypothetical protein